MEREPVTLKPDGTKPFLQGLRDSFQAEISRLKSRDLRNEHEQALIRTIIAPILLIYTLGCGWAGVLVGEQYIICLLIATFYILGSFGVLHLAAENRIPERQQRIFSLAIDHITLPVGMLAGDLAIATLYPFFLWTTFGNGFRYGRNYFLASGILSIVGFSLVLLLSPAWQGLEILGAGLLIGLIILPAYGYSLWQRLEAAKKEAVEANLAKTRFLATVSHELRTPLHSITSANNLLHSTGITKDQGDLLQGMEQSARQLLLMIDDLLDLSRIEVGSVEHKNTSLELTDFFQNMYAMFRAQAIEKALHLRIVLPHDLPVTVEAPQKVLHQIIINLLGNALKFTDTGSVTLKVEMDAASEGERLVCHVIDTGAGIPIEAQADIFHEFARADNNSTEQKVGSGLGLTIAHALALQCGGDLSLSRSDDTGSRFSLRLPVKALDRIRQKVPCDITILHPETGTLWPSVVGDDHRWSTLSDRQAEHKTSDVLVLSQTDMAHHLTMLSDSTPTPRHILFEGDAIPPLSGIMVQLQQSDEAGFRNGLAILTAMQFMSEAQVAVTREEMRATRSLSILIAEDHRANARILMRLLTTIGHQCTLVHRGDEALEALENTDFDLAILDVNMPELSGLEVTRMYRMQETGQDHLPIFFLTADVTPRMQEECADSGVDRLLTKPVDWKELQRAIEELPVSERVHRALSMSENDTATNTEPTHTSIGTDVAHITALARIDIRKIDELVQLDAGDGFLADVIDDYIADSKDISGRLINAVMTTDIVSLRDELHGLRSSSAYVGAQALVEICLTWRNKSAADLQQNREALVNEFIAVRDASIAALRHLCLRVQTGEDLIAPELAPPPPFPNTYAAADKGSSPTQAAAE